jgi:hypothetical protein
MMTRQEARDRAKRGAELLDSKIPGWADEINLDSFDIGDESGCVLGQLRGDFFEAVDSLFSRWWRSTARVCDLACAHGFNATSVSRRGREREFSEITQAWREQIAARRSIKKVRDLVDIDEGVKAVAG